MSCGGFGGELPLLALNLDSLPQHTPPVAFQPSVTLSVQPSPEQARAGEEDL